MNTIAPELLRQAHEAGIRLWLEGDSVNYIAPTGTMTEEFKSRLKAHREELIAAIRSSSPSTNSENIKCTSQYLLDNEPTYIANCERVVPVSYAQSRIWLASQLYPDDPIYNVSLAIRWHRNLTIEAFQQSINELVKRHETLRTNFMDIDGKLMQRIHWPTVVQVPLLDLREVAQEAIASEINTHRTEMACQSFDLSRTPLFRLKILVLGAQDFLLLFTAHHIIFDGWSMEVFVKELLSLHDAYVAGTPIVLPGLPCQYADFSMWQRQMLAKEHIELLLEFWRQELDDMPQLLHLRGDRPRPVMRDSRGGTHYFDLGIDLSDRVKQFSRTAGCTPYMILLAAFALLLARYCDEEDIPIGTPTAGRAASYLEPLIGTFVNNVILRVRLHGNPSILELLNRVRQTASKAFDHQELPFDLLVEHLNPKRSASYSPLFQVMFSLQNTPIAALNLDDINVNETSIHTGTSMYDLTLSLEQRLEGYKAELEFATSIFDKETIIAMAQQYKEIVEFIVANKESRLSELTMNVRRVNVVQQPVSPWLEKDLSYRIEELVEQQSQLCPNAVAIVDGDVRLAYKDLWTRATVISDQLVNAGINCNEIVGLYMEQGHELISTMLGVLKSGGAFLPLDPAYPVERLRVIVDDAKPRIILTSSKEMANRLSATTAHARVEVVKSSNDQADSCFSPANNTIIYKDINDLCYVIYTSGSTGNPKGVMVSHRNLMNSYLGWQIAYKLKDAVHRHLQMARFSFDVFIGDFVRALCSGGSLVLCPRNYLIEPKFLYQLMKRENISCAEFVPAVIRGLVDYVVRSGEDLSFMKLLIVGSDTWFMHEYRTLRKICGPDCRVINSYGLTEATIDSAYFECSNISINNDMSLIPIGSPYLGTIMYVLDSHLCPVANGVAGELYIGGDSVAIGYLNCPDLTEQKFIPDPFNKRIGARLLKTGDRVRVRNDGTYEFLGRTDNQVKIRGFRIELREIENALLQHPGVQDCAALTHNSSETKGTDNVFTDIKLVAYCVSRTEIPVHSLREFLRQRLPMYMIPAVIIPVTELPRTGSGKLDRCALEKYYYAHVPKQIAVRTPSNELETELLSMWQDILSVPIVNVDSDFFDLGGHSLLAMRLMGRIVTEFGMNLPLSTLYECPTIEQLAALIQKHDFEKRQTSLVMFRSGKPGFSSIYFVHPVGGTVLCYKQLVQLLNGDISVFGIQSTGLINSGVMDESIESMAQRYVNDILTSKNQGGRVLIGWSDGGLIAFEMARILYEMGLQPEVVVLIDTFMLVPGVQKRELNDSQIYTLFAKEQIGLFCLNDSVTGSGEVQPTELLKLLGPDISAEQLHLMYAVFRNNYLAALNYNPGKYPGRVVVIKARNQIFRQNQNPTLGWQTLCSQVCRTDEISGDHYSIMKKPNVNALANILSKHLSEVPLVRYLHK